MADRPKVLDMPFDEAIARIAGAEPHEMRESMGQPYGTKGNPVKGLPSAPGMRWQIVGTWPPDGSSGTSPQTGQAVLPPPSPTLPSSQKTAETAPSTPRTGRRGA